MRNGYTYHELYRAARAALQRVDGPNADFNAQQIVAAATARTVSQLIADYPLMVFQRDIDKTSAMVERHVKGEPLAYILGQWEFHGLTLTITPDVLIPRDDTEAVTELAMSRLSILDDHVRVLDLCAGSGCIGLAIASRFSGAKVTLGEKSPQALKIARQNVRDNHLGTRINCIQLDVMEAPDKFLGTYDMIVSNPPYITAADMETLDRSVKDYEPHMALYGGEDGLDFYRAIVKNYTPILRQGGYLAFEFGMGQEAEVCHILMENGYELDGLKRDTGMRARAVIAQKR